MDVLERSRTFDTHATLRLPGRATQESAMTDQAPNRDGSWAASRLAQELRDLYLERGEPSYRELAQRAGRSTSTISAVLSGSRVTSWQVIESIVQALDGDPHHFRKLFDLIRSERLGLEDRADELGAELGAPSTQTFQDMRTNVHSEGGTVYIQSGTPPRFDPLSLFAPADLVATYESACLAHTQGAHLAALTLARSLLEAVVARETDAGHTSTGLEALRDEGVIPSSVQKQGDIVYKLATHILHAERVAHPHDAAVALSLAQALLSCVYLGPTDRARRAARRPT
ncbi:helix-turn-helix domain-containing protein [Actinokineospora sp. 24-640]